MINIKWCESITPSPNDPKRFDALTSLWEKIYYQESKSGAQLQYGAVFETRERVPQRLDVDFGGTKHAGEVKFSEITYKGLQSTNGNGLLEKYNDKKFQEVFKIIKEGEEQYQDETEDSIVIKKSNSLTKLEIIYVMEE